MAQDKKSVLLYCDIIHTVEELTDEEAGILFKHYLRYINDKSPEPPSKFIKVLFEPIKQTLKRDLAKWENIKGKRSDAGKASAEKRQQKATNSSHVKSVEQTSTNPTVSVIDNVIDNVIDIKAAGAIDKNKIIEFLRVATDRRYITDEQIESEAEEFKNKYDGMKIGNLKTLCNIWAGNIRPWQKITKKLSSFI